jgi:hypothetical protein
LWLGLFYDSVADRGRPVLRPLLAECLCIVVFAVYDLGETPRHGCKAKRASPARLHPADNRLLNNYFRRIRDNAAAVLLSSDASFRSRKPEEGSKLAVLSGHGTCNLPAGKSPREQVVHLAHGPAIDEAAQDIGEVSLGIGGVEFTGFNERSHDGPMDRGSLRSMARAG